MSAADYAGGRLEAEAAADLKLGNAIARHVRGVIMAKIKRDKIERKHTRNTLDWFDADHVYRQRLDKLVSEIESHVETSCDPRFTYLRDDLIKAATP